MNDVDCNKLSAQLDKMARRDVLQILKTSDNATLTFLESACREVLRAGRKGQFGMVMLRESIEDFAKHKKCEAECRPVVVLIKWYEAKFDDTTGRALSEFTTDLQIAKNDKFVKSGCGARTAVLLTLLVGVLLLVRTITR